MSSKIFLFVFRRWNKDLKWEECHVGEFFCLWVNCIHKWSRKDIYSSTIHGWMTLRRHAFWMRTLLAQPDLVLRPGGSNDNHPWPIPRGKTLCFRGRAWWDEESLSGLPSAVNETIFLVLVFVPSEDPQRCLIGSVLSFQIKTREQPLPVHP